MKNKAERQTGGGAKRRLSLPERLLLAVIFLCLALALLLLLPRAPASTPEPTEEPILLRLFSAVTPAPLEPNDPNIGWQSDGENFYYLEADGRCATGLRRIGGKLYYFAPDGKKARALGVDVSFYNEDVNWREIRAQGIDFAIVRLGGRGWGGGKLYGDIRTVQYLHNAREAGLAVGAYFYSTAGSEYEAMEEARAALEALGGFRLDLPLFIDVEESGEYPEGRSDRLSRDERTRVIEAFCRVVEGAGVRAGVYSGRYFFNTMLHVTAVWDRMIWLADYSASERGQVPRFAAGYEIWQFTDRGQVKGIRGNADLNVIF